MHTRERVIFAIPVIAAVQSTTHTGNPVRAVHAGQGFSTVTATAIR